MAELTNELLHEVPRPILQDVNNIHGILARRDARLDRLERRLDLAETH